jgi:nucleoside-diphosphate-sugar epimerase
LGGDGRARANGRYAGELELRDDNEIVTLQLGPGGSSAEATGRRADPFDLQPGERYLVTGCAGFIGSHLTQALTAIGCRVVGVDAFRDNYPRSAKEHNLRLCQARGEVSFAELDVADADLGPLLEGVDGIFHLAARPGVRTSWGRTFDLYLRDNLSATQRVFEAAAERGIRVV